MYRINFSFLCDKIAINRSPPTLLFTYVQHYSPKFRNTPSLSLWFVPSFPSFRSWLPKCFDCPMVTPLSHWLSIMLQHCQMNWDVTVHEGCYLIAASCCWSDGNHKLMAWKSALLFKKKTWAWNKINLTKDMRPDCQIAWPLCELQPLLTLFPINV